MFICEEHFIHISCSSHTLWCEMIFIFTFIPSVVNNAAFSSTCTCLTFRHTISIYWKNLTVLRQVAFLFIFKKFFFSLSAQQLYAPGEMKGQPPGIRMMSSLYKQFYLRKLLTLWVLGTHSLEGFCMHGQWVFHWKKQWGLLAM